MLEVGRTDDASDPAGTAGPGATAGAPAADDELIRLRRALRDLAAVSLLHGLWDGRSVLEIADGLCGTVYRLLDLDLAVVSVESDTGPPAIMSYPAGAVGAARLLARGETLLHEGRGAAASVASHRLDLDGIGAVVVGQSSRPGFPADVEAVIFRAVANEASIAARASRRLEAARAARRTLESVVEQMPIGVAVIEAPTGRLVVRNAALDRLLALTESDEATPDAFHRVDARDPDGRPLAPGEWPMDRSLASGEVVTDEEVTIRTGDDRRITLSVSASPVRDASGAIVASVATLADISARKDTEALRDAFISMLSHELRTPVTTIYAGAQLLRRPSASQPDGDTRRELVDDIAVEAERLDRIVQNFLVLARVERGAAVRGHEPVLVQRLVPRILERELERWPDRTFAPELAADLPPVGADEASLELVVRNLVNNAAKYGGPGARVAVAGSVDEASVRVEVLDDGPGLTEDEVAHAFDLFYRSRRMMSVADGAGVGLYVVRAAVEAMGGSVWARTRPEGGAAVGFTLPIWAEDSAASAG